MNSVHNSGLRSTLATSFRMTLATALSMSAALPADAFLTPAASEINRIATGSVGPVSREEASAAAELNEGDTLEAQSFVQIRTIDINEATGQIRGESSVYVNSGETLTVLSAPVTTSIGSFVKVGFDIDDDQAPGEAWVRVADLAQDRLFAKLGEDEISEAVALGEADLFITTEVAARRGSGQRRRGITKCYRYVKLYLLRTGKVRSYLPGGSAHMAAGTLPRHGFRRTGTGPGGARVGDVCVYRGGSHGHGHIEVKTARGWYYGYGYKPAPISNRRFVACFRK